MAYEIIWSRTSLDDLRSIVEYIAQDSPARAESFGVKLISEVERISTFPQSGRVVPEYQLPVIREVIVRPYRIVYRLNQQAAQVEVARVWHAARGEPDIL